MMNAQIKNPLAIPQEYLKPLRSSGIPDLEPKETQNRPVPDKKRRLKERILTDHDTKIIHAAIKSVLDNYSKSSIAILPEISELQDTLASTKDQSLILPGNIVQNLLFRIFQLDKVSEILAFLQQKELLPFFLPDLSKAYGITQNQYHKYDIFYHSVYSCDNISSDNPLLRLAALYHDLGKVVTRREDADGDVSFHGHEIIGTRMVIRFCRYIELKHEDCKKVSRLVRNHMFHYTEDWNKSALRRFYRSIGPDLLNELFLLRLADRKANGKREGIPRLLFRLRERLIELLKEDQDFQISDLTIDGNDLMSIFELRPGPVFRKILDRLVLEVKNGKLRNERIALLEYVPLIIHGQSKIED